MTISIWSSPRKGLRIEYIAALATPVLVGLNLRNPLFDAGSEELQINQQAIPLSDLIDTLFMAALTSFTFDVDDFVGMNFRAFQPSTPLIDAPELTMCS